MKVPAGNADPTSGGRTFVSTAYHDDLLSELMQSHMVSDFCIIGPRVSMCGLRLLINYYYYSLVHFFYH